MSPAQEPRPYGGRPNVHRLPTAVSRHVRQPLEALRSHHKGETGANVVSIAHAYVPPWQRREEEARTAEQAQRAEDAEIYARGGLKKDAQLVLWGAVFSSLPSDQRRATLRSLGLLAAFVPQDHVTAALHYATRLSAADITEEADQ